MRRGPPIEAWLRIARVSNAPTVLSNVLAGAAVGLHARLDGIPVPLGALLLCCAGTVLVYSAGMVLNDAFDARADARERPGRPIPSGRIAVGHAIAVGALLLAAGSAILAFGVRSTAPWVAALAFGVVAYDALHRVLPGAFLLMAGCRALVPVIAAFSLSPGAEHSLLRWVAGGMFAFVAAVTVAARNEVRGFGRSARIATIVLAPAACAPLGIWFIEGVRPEDPVVAAAGLAAAALASLCVAMGIRTATSGAMRWAVPAAVGTWIGAIPAIDAATCFILGRPGLGAACIGLWCIAAVLRRRIAAS